MNEKIVKTKKTLEFFKWISIIFTSLAMTHFKHTFNEKYIELKSVNAESISYILYFFGGILGESIIPLIFWLIWFFYKKRLQELNELEDNRKIDLIRNHSIYSQQYNTKYESLLDLEKSKILNQSNFKEKLNKLIQEYYVQILEEQNIKEKNELEDKLKTALELGNITQAEYDQKIELSKKHLNLIK